MMNTEASWMMAAATPRPEQARDWSRMAERVKREHATIRALIDDVDRACRALEESRPGSVERFRLAVSTLYFAFDEHLAIEEASFAPMLRALGAWGDQRVVRMMGEHIEQRRVVRELMQSAAGDCNDAEVLVAQARALVAAFREDMDAEDRSLDGRGLPSSLAPDLEEG